MIIFHLAIWQYNYLIFEIRWVVNPLEFMCTLFCFLNFCLYLDICRVCRCEGTADRPLFHPCICTGSIKFIHQECLVQWLKYSKKEFCELCNYRFSFTPIYSPDMPQVFCMDDSMY